jgi:hypothetical protein
MSGGGIDYFESWERQFPVFSYILDLSTVMFDKWRWKGDGSTT